MTSKDETSLQIIATQGVWYRLLTTAFGSFFILFGAICFLAAVFVPSPPVGSNLYAIPWILMLSIIILAPSRNIILHFIFRKISHSNFLSLVHFGRILTSAVIISGLCLLIIGFLSLKGSLVLISFGLFFTYSSIYVIFSEPLTYKGEIRLLFELLLTNSENFENRQPYLKEISKIVENQLKIGNIEAPHNELFYYFNVELLKGTDIQNDLRNIEAWIVDKKTSFFESLGEGHILYLLSSLH